MELDDVRHTWRARDESRHSPSAADILREARQARIPGALAPFARGLVVALLLGLATTGLGGA